MLGSKSSKPWRVQVGQDARGLMPDRAWHNQRCSIRHHDPRHSAWDTRASPVQLGLPMTGTRFDNQTAYDAVSLTPLPSRTGPAGDEVSVLSGQSGQVSLTFWHS